MGKLFGTVERYLKYYIKAKYWRGYGIHSPFMYDFVRHVLIDKTQFEEYKLPKKLRKELKKSSQSISIIDFGAGTKAKNNAEHTTISHIAKMASIQSKFGKLLFRMAKYYNVKNALELGTSLGIGTMYIALANQTARITTIEGCPSIVAIAKRNFKQAKLNNIDLISGNFDVELPNVCKRFKQIDFVYFDGNHTYEATMNYFFIAMKYRTDHSIFVFDDIRWSQGMWEAWQAIQRHEDVKVTIDLGRMGIVFFRRELSKQDFMIRF